MKKSFVINGKFLLAQLEGMPRVARELTQGFDALLSLEKYKDVEIILAVPKGGGKLARYDNIRVEEAGQFSGILWEQIDFPLYVGSRYCLNFTNTAPLVKRNGCVVVHDAQFMSSKQSHTLKSYLLYNVVTPIVARKYRTLVTVSNYAKTEILKYGVCHRTDIRVVPNGVDHVLRCKTAVEAVEKLGLVPNGYALANSYIHAHKNVRTLLEAFAAGPPERQLVLFGSSLREEYLERKMPVPDNVKFLGRVSDEDLVSLMAFARMFLFPSTTEGFGLPPLEAMLLGCPTICSSAGAMPENCESGVLYADPYSVEDWYEKISQLWNNADERTRFSKVGKARAERFQWIAAAEQYLDIILADLCSTDFSRSRQAFS